MALDVDYKDALYKTIEQVVWEEFADLDPEAAANGFEVEVNQVVFLLVQMEMEQYGQDLTEADFVASFTQNPRLLAAGWAVERQDTEVGFVFNCYPPEDGAVKWQLPEGEDE
jgi:hypothetical protein